MNCKCRTKVFNCEHSESLTIALKRLNKEALYYFVIYEFSDKSIYLERASLIPGRTEDIKKEKDFLIHQLIEIKGKEI